MPDLYELMGWGLIGCVISALCVIVGKWVGVLTISWEWIPILLLVGILPPGDRMGYCDVELEDVMGRRYRIDPCKIIIAWLFPWLAIAFVLLVNHFAGWYPIDWGWGPTAIVIGIAPILIVLLLLPWIW